METLGRRAAAARRGGPCRTTRGGGRARRCTRALTEEENESLLKTVNQKETWQAFVEFAYTREIHVPFGRVMEFYSDRKKRRRGESTREEIRATAKKCLEMAPALRRMSARLGMRGMNIYLDRSTRAARKFIKRRVLPPSSSDKKSVPPLDTSGTSPENAVGAGKGKHEDASPYSSSSSLGQLLKYDWGQSSADVIFCTGDGSCMPAHRVMVCARSSYFRAMLSEEGSFAESHMDTVPVQVESGDVFSHVLHYIYTGQASTLEPGTSFDVLNAAHMYGLAGLQALCEDHIAQEYMETDNVCDILNATSELPECRLRLNSIAFLLTHVVEVVAASQMSRNDTGGSGKESDDSSLAEILRDPEKRWTEELGYTAPDAGDLAEFYGRDLTAGEVACFATHHAAWVSAAPRLGVTAPGAASAHMTRWQAASVGEEWVAVVLEDDVTVLPCEEPRLHVHAARWRSVWNALRAQLTALRERKLPWFISHPLAFLRMCSLAVFRFPHILECTHKT